MPKFLTDIPLPPEDVVDTTAEMRAYYRDMERELDRQASERPGPGEY